MSEELIVKHCSPTLAGLKAASLFSCTYENAHDLKVKLKKRNVRLNPKGIHFTVLRLGNHQALIFVYRIEKLKRYLFKPENMNFLVSIGYKKENLKSLIEELSSRLNRDGDFPHEIGLFLGYPLDDIEGFIKNKGKNSKCVGCWKVYTNEDEAEKTFEKYRKCTEIYYKNSVRGVSIMRLTVTA